MKTCKVYLDGESLLVNPSEISLALPMRTLRFDLIQDGEIEMLKGLNLAKITMKGILRQGTQQKDADTAIQETIEKWESRMRSNEPVRLIYTGQKWDLNMLCTIKNIEFYEIGGTFDVEYTMKLHEWKNIDIRMAAAETKRKKETANQTASKMYSVKQGDTLSHIAKSLLGDSSRWRELYDLNRDILSNPNRISVGQNLILPDDAAGSVPQRSHKTNTKKTYPKKSSQKKPNKKPSTNASNGNTATKPIQSPSTNNSYMSAADIFAQYKKKR